MGAIPVVVALFVLGGDGVLGAGVSGVVAASAVVAAWWGGRRHLDLPVLRWCLAGCAALFVLSELARQAVLTGASLPTVLPQLLALAAYGLVLLFAVIMVRRVAHHAGPVLWLDASLLSLGVLVVVWTFVVPPVVDDPARLLEAATGVVYVGIDALV
ncbi:hypothetical protein, partial [Solicola sp. PLA-1-18]|uniref:hypothetical protein n=1 Tax=Solicola sp. PLA-1-18 TaxID=3380532 RepID=UPI003B7A5B43